MHIKKIIIKGFKSYLALTDLEEFSKGYNVICGRNGSGKSNLFAALQFVLSDEYGSLNPEQRQMLLHEGSGREVFTAYVEIVFDNSDGRFPVEANEVSIRRTVGAKKDEYFLDKKHATKQDIINFLESAGFSRSNPYYIVQQGKIQELALMSEEARLDLLKEVAGTRVYEERRTESAKLMEDSTAKKAQIDEMLTNLNERLAELEEERSELLEFQKLDTTRRSLQYAIYEKDRELQEHNLSINLTSMSVHDVNAIDKVVKGLLAEQEMQKTRIVAPAPAPAPVAVSVPVSVSVPRAPAPALPPRAPAPAPAPAPVVSQNLHKQKPRKKSLAALQAAPPPASPPTVASSASLPPAAAPPAAFVPMCFCGIPAVRRQVTKLGPNVGRLFFGCSRFGSPHVCTYFAWDVASVQLKPAPPAVPVPVPVPVAVPQLPVHERTIRTRAQGRSKAKTGSGRSKN